MDNLKIIKEIINEWDPIGLFPMAPKDEYENEIDKIASFIASTKISEETNLAKFIEGVFVTAFGKEDFNVSSRECRKIARKIIDKIY